MGRIGARKYTKRSMHVEAIRWDGTVKMALYLSHWATYSDDVFVLPLPNGNVHITGPSGEETAKPGDYILKDSEGIMHSCTSEEFSKIYEPKEETICQQE